MGNSLQNKIALVTGASTGIGLGIAKRFVSDGAQVVITGYHQAELNAAVAEIGPRATGIRTDVAKMPPGPPAVVARSAEVPHPAWVAMHRCPIPLPDSREKIYIRTDPPKTIAFCNTFPQ
jgi:hypothetical protein